MPLPRAKKHLGQHFLHDVRIAERVAQAIAPAAGQVQAIVEIGPGPGALTRHLYDKWADKLWLIEIDGEMVPRLHEQFPKLGERILQADFLEADLGQLPQPLAVIGNFPYNISTQIVFRIIENRHRIAVAAGMFQREVAQRIASAEGSKVYGILSVLSTLFFKTEYLFTVNEGSFVPPPKVKSGVIRMTRHAVDYEGVEESKLFSLVKAGFQQRRKTLRNALSGVLPLGHQVSPEFLDKRAEQLSPQRWLELYRAIYPQAQ